MQIPLRYRLPCFRQGAFCLVRGFSRSRIPTASWKACTRRCAGTLGSETNAFSALAIARRHRSDTPHSTGGASPAAQYPADRSLEAVRPLSDSPSASTSPSRKDALSSSASPSPQSHPSNAHPQSFSQGLTEFRWREESARTGVYVPSVLQAESVRNRVRLFGMPKGFPATTAVGFRRFFYLSQANSFIADFSACIGYQSLLSGFFLGSSPQMWMLKDLFPALIAAYMANRLVSYESRPKQWFCVSVLLRNLTIIADMVIPSALPQHMVLAAVANAVLKQSSALMFFITRAAALQHYATDNNLAELTKKFNSFSMVTFTLATALAIVYCTFLTSFAAQLTTIFVCCAANMSLSYLAMSPIAFRILNGETMQVLLQSYVMEKGRVMTPQMVSDLMGIHMSATAALKAEGAHTDIVPNLLYISPPIDKLIIRSDTLRDDVLYLDSRGAVLIALWQPSAKPLTLQEVWRRYELPPFLRLLRSAFRSRRAKRALGEMEKRFGGHRLCLLVHHKCTPRDLVTAYLILYAAVLQHASTEAELRAFVRQCHAEQEVWRAKGEQLYEELKEAGWDVERPALDHHDFRLSDLVLQTPQRVEDC